jgi:hypothetical protein
LRLISFSCRATEASAFSDCIVDKGNETFETTIASKNYDRPKTTGECVEYFQYLGSILSNVEDVLVKLSVGLLWLKLHSTRRGLFLLAHWTWN